MPSSAKGPPLKLIAGLFSGGSGSVEIRHGYVSRIDAIPQGVWRPQQVHGNDIVRVTRLDMPPIGADGAISIDPAIGVGVIAADCVPLLLATRNGKAVAAVHSGWRGLASGIVERAVEQLHRQAPEAPILAVIGPAAGECCYEVGPEVAVRLQADSHDETRDDDGRRRIDLRGLVSERLVNAGVERSKIQTLGPCTICSAGWPSYRRQRDRAGRLAGYIFPRSNRG